MSPFILFGLLLILTFGALLLFLKPSSTETAVEKHLAGLQEVHAQSGPVASILKQEGLSTNPLLDDMLRQVPWSASVARLIRQAGQTWSVGAVLGISVAGGLLGMWIGSIILPTGVLAVVAGVFAALVPFITLYILREARFMRFDNVLPEAVDLMSRGLRAGHAISAVLEMVGREVADPVGAEFRAMHKECSLGLPMREAMEGMVERVPRDDMRFLATAILLQKESGGNLVQILDKTAHVIRERARLRGQLRIYTAQGRITGWILCFAPFIMFGLISAVNHNYEKTLFTDPFGLKMVYGALGLMLLGILAIRKIISIKV